MFRQTPSGPTFTQTPFDEPEDEPELAVVGAAAGTVAAEAGAPPERAGVVCAGVAGFWLALPLSVVPPPSARRVVEPEDIYDSIDPVLDKISKSGIGSLTASERRALDRARNRLLNKSK
jgi:hypothetical protein